MGRRHQAPAWAMGIGQNTSGAPYRDPRVGCDSLHEVPDGLAPAGPRLPGGRVLVQHWPFEEVAAVGGADGDLEGPALAVDCHGNGNAGLAELPDTAEQLRQA
jgi:hypothetical protein